MNQVSQQTVLVGTLGNINQFVFGVGVEATLQAQTGVEWFYKSVLIFIRTRIFDAIGASQE